MLPSNIQVAVEGMALLRVIKCFVAPLGSLHAAFRGVVGKMKRICLAQFRSLAEPWADTGTSTGRLMLAVLGGLADVERDLIRTRTAEGRSRAKAQGKAMGRPPSPDTDTAERGHQTARAGRYVAGIGGQLRPQFI